MKAIRKIVRGVRPHWVGDGFPVRSLFSYSPDRDAISPFLLFDYAGPYDFVPNSNRPGVEEHPHRGFETVTIVYQGEVEHRDSAGNSGRVGPGDVQWMTAARGVVHEEFHSAEFAQRGGTLEMAQLWVNLPAAEKMAPPRYQEILASRIPAVSLPDDAGTLRVIAGEFNGTQGAARTVTPINLWDLKLTADVATSLPIPEGHNAFLLVRRGLIRINGIEPAATMELIAFDRHGSQVELTAIENAEALLLTGEPIDEPVAGQGPFVMNTRDELRKAIADYQSGQMGSLS